MFIGKQRIPWSTINAWIHGTQPIPFPSAHQYKPSSKKCPDIPVLPSYKFPPPEDFWLSFPHQPLPKKPTSPVNPATLEAELSAISHTLSRSQLARAAAAVQELKHGAKTPLTAVLPPLREPNTPSAAVHGEIFTDNLAFWIRKGFVAGPFTYPPSAGTRCNSMIAVEQKGKIRIIMNMSAPQGQSLNDSIDETRLEKVEMSSAKKYGYSIIDCGVGARMWKWDWDHAYKNIPAPLSEHRLQGFRWLGKYFIETQQVFGSKSAVSAFDRLGHTIADMAAATAGLPSAFMHRTLDDLPIVTPADSNLGTQFAAAYTGICKRIGASLAKNCPDKEKAFEDSTTGTVLGIKFDTNNLTWSLPAPKAARTLLQISAPFHGLPVSLKQTEKLVGLLNDIAQMCPVLKGFKHNILQLLQSFNGNESVLLTPTDATRQDLRIWAAAVISATDGLPISPRPTLPPSNALVFVSDAAGAQFSKVQGRFIPLPPSDSRGGASINEFSNSDLWFCSRVTWPITFLTTARDTSDHAYGCKSSTLEAIAAILPFLTIPSILRNRDIILLTDNESVVYGWLSRRIPQDTSASIFIRALHIISVFLNCNVTIRHLPRMSTPAATLADQLTRDSTTQATQRRAIHEALQPQPPQPLIDWLSNPSEDWSLPLRLLDHVRTSE